MPTPPTRRNATLLHIQATTNYLFTHIPPSEICAARRLAVNCPVGPENARRRAEGGRRSTGATGQRIVGEGATLRRAAEYLQKRLWEVDRILSKVTVPADDVIDEEVLEDYEVRG
ncbi:hypothetical protein [Streptomyces sp. NPDC058297]|uniref:hypothetical protein n=1 Tax=Streptomyces sp. NPDC058297 TaxID=3346433 RepID=UPI0036EA3267